jgi:hypothetical protein
MYTYIIYIYIIQISCWFLAIIQKQLKHLTVIGKSGPSATLAAKKHQSKAFACGSRRRPRGYCWCPSRWKWYLTTGKEPRKGWFWAGINKGWYENYTEEGMATMIEKYLMASWWFLTVPPGMAVNSGSIGCQLEDDYCLDDQLDLVHPIFAGEFYILMD